MRAWQKMLSGRRLDLTNPSAMDIEIEDIAQGLSRVARWNGQTAGEHALSVAQHSLLMEKIARTLEPNTPAEWLFAVLLHDAAEYVVGDMVAPFKNAAGVDYHTFAEKLMQAINVRFGLPAALSPQLKKFIKRADKAAAYLEATQLAGFTDAESRTLFGVPPLTIKDWAVLPQAPNYIKHDYLERFYALLEGLESDSAAA